MLPFLLVILLAVSWKDDRSEAALQSPSRLGNLAVTHVLPILIPLLVIFMGHRIAREQLTIAWLAIVASFLCAAVRLILTNRRQVRMTDHLLEAERALSRSKQLLSTAFRASPDGFSINIFPDGPFLDVNDGFTRLTGYTREEVLNKTPLEVNLWLEPARRSEILSCLTTQGEVHEAEFQFRTKAGQVRTGQLSGSLVTLDGRKCALVAVRDVTERKAADDLLRNSEERFRTLIDDLHVGIIIYDPQVRVLFANKAVQNAFGNQYKEFLGKTTEDLGLVTLREDGTEMPPAARPVPRVLATKRPVKSQVVGVSRLGSTDATWTLVDAIPEFDAGGEVARVIVSITDLTEQRRATGALRDSEERFRSFVENLHIGIVSSNSEAHIQYANPAALNMFGMTVEEVTGKTEIDLGLEVLREDGSILPGSQGLIPTVVGSRRPLHNLVVGWRDTKTQKVIWTLLDAVPQLNAFGGVTDILVSLTDLTEQRRANEALRESEERFRTLVRDLHVAVVLHNPDATIQFANKAALGMGSVSLEQALGKTTAQLGMTAVDVDGRAISPEHMPAPTVIRTKLPVLNQVLGLHRPGNSDLLWIFGNALPQFAPDGSLLRVITSFSDITEMKNAERSIHQLSTELLKLQDAERRRIGRELHDGMAQTVLAVNLSLAQIRQSTQPLSEASSRALEKARELLQQMSREIRTLSYLLHPPLLDDLGLVTALKEYVNGFGERSGIETSLDVPQRFRRLPQIVETTFFRITQESLSNIQRHSGSKKARVVLREDTESVTLEISDFGHGMNLPANGNVRRLPVRLGVGIPGMRERMAQVGGYLDIESNSSGTTIRARILVSAAVLKETTNDESAPAYRG